ncbi:MAG: phospho-N-acetylmuramoyl-pentapeptide-transferase [Chlorobiota bacterium]|nr:phospho-N-acetylmuramoyl-pentapeptide-transferase [Chlorobiota bacterium]QQS66697.1 MAG: phospho-N-acetylmuramoyl-pentapeptide-transferase [Chlorobiota bacterium]
MLYYLAKYLDGIYHIPGIGLFRYTTFRAASAALVALTIGLWGGPKIISFLKNKQIGEQGKKEAPKNHLSKAGTPTMGGLIVLLSITVPVLLFCDIKSAFVILAISVTLFLGVVGFIDDYLKVVKKLPKGLIGRYKIVGQVFIGFILGGTIYFFPEFFSTGYAAINTKTTIPFIKTVLFDFGWLYIPMVIFVLTATSNAVNLTDGLDGLAIGTVSIVALAIGLITYVSGNIIVAKYLNIPFISGADELTIMCAGLFGACLGFMWYNAYPAQIFMGDTGSLALGGAIGSLMILVKKEYMIPILGGVFFAESLSVIIQVMYFKYTKKRYGEGRRIFKMSPLHHHFELSGWAEAKIVTRFIIVAAILAIIALTTLKIR